MSLIDKHFKEALKNLPEKKLSWAADRHIRKSIRQRASELDGKQPFWMYLKRFAAAPVALALLLVSTGGYAYVSPSVVQGDLLYPVKTELENRFYPEDGSSEERVAYHLKLSQRRYAEVQEILDRRSSGKKTASLVYAQGITVDPLDDILVKTLQRATQHVEYAFLVTDEIKEVEKVKIVKAEIKKTLESQREVLKEVAPILEEVKFLEKPKARQKTVKEEIVPKVIADAIDSGTVNSDDPSEALIAESRSVPEFPDDALVEVSPKDDLSDGFEEFIVPPTLDAAMVEIVIEVEQDLDDAAEFLLDRFAFQDELLESMEDAIEEAEVLGIAELELDVTEELEIIVEAELSKDAVFVEALAVHYEQEQIQLEEELEKLDEILIATSDEGPNDKGQGPSEDEKEPKDLKDENEKDSKDLKDDKDLKKEKEKEKEKDSKDLKDLKDGEEKEDKEFEESKESEEVIIAVADPELEDDREVATVSIAASDDVLESEDAVLNTPVEEPGDEVSIVAVEVEIEELPEVLEGVAEASVVADEPEVSILSADPVILEEVDETLEEVSDIELFIERCKQAIRELCSEYAIGNCLDRGNEQCESVQTATDIQSLLDDARTRLDQRQLEQDARSEAEAVLERMEETRVRIQTLDTRIERLEGGR
jgi:hypothetical protein